MKAALLCDGATALTIHDVTYSDPMGHEVLLRTKAVGLCHSDYHYVDGTLDRQRPVMLGHEAVGVVEAVGPLVTSVAVGDRVVTCLVIGCGSCRRCEMGEPNVCANAGVTRRSAGQTARVTCDGVTVTQMANIGALGEYTLMDERGVVRIDDDVPDELAAILGCAVVTGLGAVFNVAEVQAGDTVAVIGAGGVGLNVIQGARIAGASQVIAIDTAAAKLSRAQQLGATDVIDSSTTDAVAAVRALTGDGVDHAFEVVGRPATAALAFDLAAPNRTAYIVGVMADDAMVSVPAIGLRRGKRIVGVFMGSTRPRVDIPRYVEMWRRGQLDLASMVSRTLPLADVNEGFAAMTRGEVARSVVVMADPA
jgi:S-(hydroxymethyl)glutathione dehydrogenase / alcohol dehydrogenase